MLGLEAGASLTLNTIPTLIGDRSGFMIGVDCSEAEPVSPSLRINGPVDVSNANFGVKIEAGNVKSSTKVRLLTATDIMGYEYLSRKSLPQDRNWKFSVEQNEDNTKTLYAVIEPEFIIFLK